MQKITQKKLKELEGIKTKDLKDIAEMARAIKGDDCYYFECRDGKFYAGGYECFTFIKKGYRADYCVYQKRIYQL